jgi:dihydrofolate synthase/folylpolyglutamate synthase
VRSGADPALALEYLGYEALLGLPDKERGGAEVLGWDGRRMRRWLGRLGDPHLRMRCTVVAGSKGKGSTAAMLESILRHAGRRTGLYTQPHLHRYAERIRVGGRMLPASESRAGLRQVLALAPGPVTAFEAATALCLWTFARAGVEEAVLEVGFGGRLDAVAEAEPELVLFGPLEEEHRDLLGPTLADVAAHELALCRYGRVCLSAPQPPAVEALLLERLRAHGAEGGVVQLPREVGGRLVLTLPGGEQLPVRLGLAGPFQRMNAALAAAGAAALGAPPAAVAAGLARVRWPGRWERLSRAPTVLADGAHTPASAAAARRALEEELARRRGAGARRVALVVGMLADKDAAGFAGAFAGLGCRVWTVTPDHPRAMPADRLAEAFTRAGLSAAVASGVESALEAACRWAGPSGLCLATGSLRLVAQVRARYGRGPRTCA